MAAPLSSAAEPPLRIGAAGPDLLRRAADAGRLYAVFDPCVDDGAYRWLGTLDPARISCLYEGPPATNYADKAPYALRVDAALLAALTQRFGAAPWGCLIVSDAPPAALRRHLRQWLSVRSPEGETWLFRFWDPRLLATYLRASDADQLNAFFGPIATFATIDGAGGVFAASRATAIVAPPPRRAVGEHPAIGPAQVAALRRAGLGDRLAETFADTPVTVRRDPANGDVLLRAPDGGIARMHLADDGQIGGTTSALGRRWTTTHRPDGKLVAFATPSGATLSIGYDAAGRVASVARNGVGRFRADHDPYDRIERVVFPDGSDARIAYASQGAAALADPAGERIGARRDRIGRTERFDYRDGALAAIVDGNGHTTRIARDAAGRPEALHFADGRREAYRYDPAGHLAAIVRASGKTVTVTCDDAGRPLAIRSEDGNDARFAYDDAGRLVAAADAGGELHWRYDDRGRLVEERCGDAVTRYDYDAIGLVALTWPDGSCVRYVRDADQRLAAICDWTGGWHRIDHADRDGGWRIASPDGTVATTTLDPVGRITGQQVDHRGQALWQVRYAHDDDDRLCERQDSRLGTASFAYDAEGQLLRHARASGGVEEFAYDGAGNRIACGAGAARFDAADRILNQGATRFDHDADGAVLRRIGPDGDWRFTHDARGRLIAAEDGAGRRLTFGYDALGRRRWKRVTGDGQDRTIRFDWAGEQMIRETVDDGPARDYLYWPQGWLPLLLREGDALYHYHCDPAGTPVRLTDGDGTVAWESDGEAFGAARPLVARVAQPLRLPGQYADDAFGLTLHYNRFRYYDPATGRYLSPDPIGVAGGLNLYLYAGNDPVNRADPLGLWWKTALSIVAAVAVAAIVVATAPISGPLLILAAGAAAGAAGFMVNEALNQEKFCASCILLAGIKGAAVGAVAALPFLWLPSAAGVGIFAAAGAGSGFLGYSAEWALTPGMEWSWGDAAKATGIGAATGGLGRYLGGKFGGGKPPATRTAEPPPAPSRTQPRATPPRPPVTTPPRPPAAPASSPPPAGPRRGPDGRFQPSGRAPQVRNRSTEYPSGYRADVVDDVLDAHTIQNGPNKGMVRTADGRIVARDHPDMTMEHNTAVVDHWNQRGYNMTRAERNDFYNDRSNLSPMLRGDNSAGGGRMSAAGVRYRQDVGPNYR